MIFAFDRIVNGIPVPNAVQYNKNIKLSEYSKIFPYSETVHFLEYLQKENINYTIQTVDYSNSDAIYPISLSFFDFNVNWKTTIPKIVFDKQIPIWFLYSEGDDPLLIKQQLDSQLGHYQYHFTSANTASQNLEKFSYFADDELLYRLRNIGSPVPYHSKLRTKKFTALSRVHKNWRANTMAVLWNNNLHEQGYFSYSTDIDLDETANPLETGLFIDLEKTTEAFLKKCPFEADSLGGDAHNDHSLTLEEHHSNSYINLVLETHLSTENDSGVFVSEKIFKPIKNNQLFIVIGCAGTIRLLKDIGYKTFDDLIDHTYDNIADHTQRWHTALNEFKLLMNCDLHKIYQSCKKDLEYNSQLFSSSKHITLNNLITKVKNELSK